jgi:DNA-binding GntR family transcriptional regulator
LSKPHTKAGRTLLRKANLATLAQHEINRRIMVGELAEGAKVNLMDLARELGTSIIPIREALARLSAERLVIYEPNKGFRVAPAPDAEEIANLFEARIVLELGALDVGIHNVDEAVLNELIAVNDDIRNHQYGKDFEDFSDFVHQNARFHELLIGLTNNALVLDAYRRLSYHQRIPLLLHGQGVQDLDVIIAEHDEIIAALKARSLTKARKALRAHIVGGYGRLPARDANHPFRPLKASMPAR